MLSTQGIIDLMSEPAFEMGSHFGREAILEHQATASEYVTVKGVLTILESKLSSFDELPDAAQGILSRVQQEPAFVLGAVASALDTVRSTTNV